MAKRGNQRNGRRPRASRADHAPTPIARPRRSSAPIIQENEQGLRPQEVEDLLHMENLALYDGTRPDPTPNSEEELEEEEQDEHEEEIIKPFRFLDLPTELRLNVYRHHFAASLSHPVDLSPTNYREIHKKQVIFRTCRQIHQEASHYFYSTHVFRLFPVSPGRYFKTKKPLLARLRPSQRASITALQLRVGPGWAKPPRGWVVNTALGLAQCINVRHVSVFVECDPSDPIFRGFRKSEGFYEAFCRSLLTDVLDGLPSVHRVQFDAWPSVKRNGPMMRGLLETARGKNMTVSWGPPEEGADERRGVRRR